MHMCVLYVLLVYRWSTYGRKRVRERERERERREREREEETGAPGILKQGPFSI